MKFTVQSLAEKIAQDNEKFDNASPAEKRVIVAQDCLIRIDLGQILPETGNFCGLSTFEEPNIKTNLDTVSTRVCRACAKGSLFMAYLGRVNNFDRYELINGNDEDGKPHLKILEIFDLTQLALIEYAFEGKLYIGKDNDVNLEDHYFNGVCEFRENVIKENNLETRRIDYEDYCHEVVFAETGLEIYGKFDDLMLRAICNNIIENKGEFVL